MALLLGEVSDGGLDRRCADAVPQLVIVRGSCLGYEVATHEEGYGSAQLHQATSNKTKSMSPRPKDLGQAVDAHTEQHEAKAKDRCAQTDSLPILPSKR